MHAADAWRAQPDGLHRGDVEALEGAVERLVRAQDGVVDAIMTGFGAIMTSSIEPPGARDSRTPWPSPAGAQTRSPGATSRSSSPTRDPTGPSST